MTGIFLIDDKTKDSFRIPVNPSELPFANNADGEEYSISKTGTVNVPKPMKLPEFSFSSYFPSERTHYSETEFIEPKTYIEKIEKWMAELTVIRFIYVGGSFTINDLVTIESFEYKDQFGTDDVEYTISFKKYVPFGFKKMEVVKQNRRNVSINTPNVPEPKVVAKKETEKRADTKPVPQSYSLVAGDSLWKIAQKYTGNGSNYKELQKLNGIKDSDLRKLPIGLKVKIPPSWTGKN